MAWGSRPLVGPPMANRSWGRDHTKHGTKKEEGGLTGSPRPGGGARRRAPRGPDLCPWGPARLSLSPPMGKELVKRIS